MTARADWAFGSETDATDGTVLVVIVAQRWDQFSAAEARLLSYLAILCQLRINLKKENCTAQGCYTDGERYVFICIDNDGRITTSKMLDIGGHEQCTVVFNYIVGVLETAKRTVVTTGGKDVGADVAGLQVLVE